MKRNPSALKHLFALFLSMLCSVPIAAEAGTFTALGPKNFIRSSGAPVTESVSFSIKNPNTTYTLHIYNGGYDSDYSLVSSAVITLNGTTIFTTSDFNQKVVHLERQVSLNAFNELKVDLRSSPASAITIVIEGIDDTAPFVTIINPLSNAYLNMPTVVVTGSAYDSMSWIKAVTVNGTNAQISGDGYSVGGVQLTEGVNPINVVATDAAGNTSSTGAEVFLDTIPPSVILNPVPPITNNPHLQISGSLTDASPITGFTINGTPVNLTNNSFSAAVNLLEGNNIITVSATDKAGNVGGTSANLFLDTIPPTLSISDPSSGTYLKIPVITVTGSASDIQSGLSAVSVNGINAVMSNNTFTVSNIQLTEGSNTITVVAVDMAGNKSSTSIILYLDDIPPTITLTSPANGSTVKTNTITVTGTVDDNSAAVTVNGVNATVSNNAFTASGISLIKGINTIMATAVDPVGNTGMTTITVTYAVSDIPPDPATVAPPIDKTVATNIASATTFLYTGENPIQTGVAPGTIEAQRAAVLRGQATNKDGTPLSGVKITVLNHPEYGSTLTREDGMFDMAVNGGGWLTVNYEKTGYLPSQRQVNAPWQDYAWLPEVVLIPFDTKSTVVNLLNSNTIQVAQGSTITDADGTRKSTLIFTPGTGATMKLADDTWLSISNFTVRATEYTVGENGPKAMPGPLPPTSGYTYAAEYSLDEAVMMGAKYVSFSKPVISYVENFLNFPVGGIVPVGWYDREKGAWIPSDNGKIIKILSISSGMAEIDVDGSNTPATTSTLSSLGISDEERQTIASLYQAGQSLWRVPISHFTPWDFNWPYGPPEDATDPKQPQAQLIAQIDDPCIQPGSIIECQNQTLGESINTIVGMPFNLNYKSDRVPGRKAAYTLNIPLSGTDIPASLKRIDLEIYVAGKRYFQSFNPAINLTYPFTWDGKDIYGRTLNGAQPVTIRLGYAYQAVYQQPATATRGFAALSGLTITGSKARNEFIIWQVNSANIGAWDSREQSLGGWTLNIQHFYDASSRILNTGDGKRRSSDDISNIITTVVGNGIYGYSGDGGPATDAKISNPWGIAIDAQGNRYIGHAGLIRQVSPDGIITTIAGKGGTGYGGDSGPAINASLNYPSGIAVDVQGNIYIADTYNRRIRKVGTDGIISTVAGNGVPIAGYSGEGGPATNARLMNPRSVAVDGQGNLYIADYRILKVGTDGIITTVAGNGSYGYSGDGGPSVGASMRDPYSIAVDNYGSIYIADTNNHRIRKVGLDGIIKTVAGGGNPGFSGDGGPAIAASLWYPVGVAIDDKGNIYIAENGNNRIRHVAPDGIITTLAGNGTYGFSGDRGTATRASFGYPFGVAVDAQNNILIADGNNRRIRMVSSPMPGFSVTDIVIPSDDSRELYVFSASGKHLRTVDATTGLNSYTFTYDTTGYLTAVTDRNGNITPIERDSSGNPTAIIAPGGQRTELALDANGYLASVTNQNGEAYQMTYTADGLLTTFTKPTGSTSTFTYNSLGLLIKDEDPAGGFKALSRTENGNNNYTVSVSTAEGRTNTYQVEGLSTGASRRTNTEPSSLTTITNIGTDGTTTTTEPNGTITTTVEGPDPRFGMQSPITTSMTIITPGNLTYSLSEGRTVTLSDQSNPLSLTTQTDTKTVNGKTFTSLYDASLKKITATSPVGRQRFSLLDEKGRVYQEQTAELEAIGYQYDAKGRLTGITHGTRQTTMAYDTLNQIGSITDAANRTVSFAYDLAGRVTQQTLPDSRVINYTYDANGNVTSITTPGRPAHNFYIGIGNVNTQYAYNLDKQLTLITRPDGQTIGFNYDNGGRLSTINIPTGNISYTYNATTGNTGTISSPGETLSFSYDGSLLTGQSWSGAVTGSVGFVYNNDFRVTSESINGANAISYVYDNDGLLTGAGSLTISRNSQNGLITGSTLGSVSDSFTYSTFGEPSRYTANYGGSALFDVQYTRDNLGRITSKTETISGTTSTYTYAYDQAGRLTDVAKNGTNVGHYDYDSNGNRVGWAAPTGSGVATYDNQDRLVSYGSATYIYTTNGELQSKATGGQTTNYNYDVLGNLKAATLPDGTSIEYIVDGQNRRIGKKVNGAPVQGFLYENQLRPIAELDGAGNIVSRFVYGTKPNVPEFMIKGGVTYRIISDHLGSPRLVVNSSTGAIAQQIDYDEFGNVTSDTNPGFMPFGFAGGLYDRDTKLVRFGARDYDAETGRWTAHDPIRFEGGTTNLYQYGNNPINEIDPSGLALVCPGKNDPLDDLLKDLPDWLKDLIKDIYYDPTIGPLGMSKFEGKTIQEILALKKGSIKNAPLPKGTPGWNDIANMTMEQINNLAKSDKGFKTIKKLLTDSRFDK